MNDRFKFRAWDKVRKQYEDCKVFINTNGKLIGFYTRDERLDEFYTVEQCTGLKDKNGKLIYEGDIVDVQEHIDNVNGNYIVEWSDVCHHWNLRSIFKDSWGADRNFSFSDLNCFNETSEVIGNIHENAELLK